MIRFLIHNCWFFFKFSIGSSTEAPDYGDQPASRKEAIRFYLWPSLLSTRRSIAAVNGPGVFQVVLASRKLQSVLKIYLYI